MSDRNSGEKAKIEKRLRLERTVIPVVCVLAVAAFIVLCAVFGKNGLTAGDAPAAPTEDPCVAAIHGLAEKLGGEYTDGKDMSSLSFKSAADGTYATVSAYCRSGVLCMQIVRTLALPEEPEATEDMFENTDISTPDPSRTDEMTAMLEAIADEILLCLEQVETPPDAEDAGSKVLAALGQIADGGASKASFVYGIRLAEFKYSKTDKLLTVICEPVK